MAGTGHKESHPHMQGSLRGERKGKGQAEPVFITFLHFFRTLLDYGICLYLFLVLGVMPFYFQDGYSHIGSDKATFFCKVSVEMGKVLLPLAVIYLVMQAVENKEYMKMRFYHLAGSKPQTHPGSWTWTDSFAAFYGVALVLSYLFSPFKERALWGADRWFMGFGTQMILVGIYFLVSRFWKPRRWMFLVLAVASGLVFTLGYLNRFSVYPIHMTLQNPGFISTIGNINWYCGYVVSVLFAGVGFLWLGSGPGRERRALQGNRIFQRGVRTLLAIYIVLGFGTLVTQGSDSGILALAVVLLVLFVLSASEGERMLAFWKVMLLLCAACLVTLGLWKMLPGRMNYEGDAMELLLSVWILLPMTVVSVMAFLWIYGKQKKGAYPAKLMKYLTRTVTAAAIAGVVLILVLAAINTALPGSLGPLSAYPVFTFSEDWGSSRGATWKAGWMCYLEQDPLHKLTGVGPDAMWEAISTQGSTALREMVREKFNGLSLTNAHNEWLTILVDVGLLGLVGFAGMMVTGMAGFLREGKRNVFACICGLCLLGYTVNNIFSFQQAMGVATIFTVFGMGRAFQRAGSGAEGKYIFVKSYKSSKKVSDGKQARTERIQNDR